MYASVPCSQILAFLGPVSSAIFSYENAAPFPVTVQPGCRCDSKGSQISKAASRTLVHILLYNSSSLRAMIIQLHDACSQPLSGSVSFIVTYRLEVLPPPQYQISFPRLHALKELISKEWFGDLRCQHKVTQEEIWEKRLSPIRLDIFVLKSVVFLETLFASL